MKTLSTLLTVALVMLLASCGKKDADDKDGKKDFDLEKAQKLCEKYDDGKFDDGDWEEFVDIYEQMRAKELSMYEEIAAKAEAGLRENDIWEEVIAAMPKDYRKVSEKIYEIKLSPDLPSGIKKSIREIDADCGNRAKGLQRDYLMRVNGFDGNIGDIERHLASAQRLCAKYDGEGFDDADWKEFVSTYKGLREYESLITEEMVERINDGMTHEELAMMVQEFKDMMPAGYQDASSKFHGIRNSSDMPLNIEMKIDEIDRKCDKREEELFEVFNQKFEKIGANEDTDDDNTIVSDSNTALTLENAEIIAHEYIERIVATNGRAAKEQLAVEATGKLESIMKQCHSEADSLYVINYIIQVSDAVEN